MLVSAPSSDASLGSIAWQSTVQNLPLVIGKSVSNGMDCNL